jgi:hypothetical protein
MKIVNEGAIKEKCKTLAKWNPKWENNNNNNNKNKLQRIIIKTRQKKVFTH